MRRAWPLVDRDRELRQLVELLKSSLGGSRGFAIIEGPAGIGKSRLLSEVLLNVGDSRIGVLTARCSPLEQDATFGAVRRLLGPVINASTSDRQDELFAGPAADAAGLLDKRTAGCNGSEFAIFHALYWLLANLCQQAPQILVVDDLHWCDGPSLRFLAYLVHRSEDLPLTILMAARPTDPGGETRLLDHIATEPGCLALRLGPLSERSGLDLLAADLGPTAHPEFLAACHHMTAGNPLLLGELVDLLIADGVAPSADNVDAITAISSQSVARWVRNRMTPMGRDLVEIAQAVAVLGDGVRIRSVCGVAEVPVGVGLEAIDKLCLSDILRQDPHSRESTIEFVHPLVREAIYNGMDRVTRSRKHARAVEVLNESDCDVEDVAAHVLLTQHPTMPTALTVLRIAARQATSRGAPEGAVVYLRRCLIEKLSDRERAEMLVELGAAAQLVDLPAAAGYLRQALELGGDGAHTAAMRGLLAGVLLQMGDSSGAVETMTDAIDAADANDVDVRHRLEALLLNVPILEPGWQHLVPVHPPVDVADRRAGVGRRMVDAVYSLHETFACNPMGPIRAQSALVDDVLIREISGEGALVCAWLSLLAAENPAAMASLDAAIAYAHRHGSVRGVSPAYAHRGLAWLWQGQLADAESDLMEARAAVDTGNIRIGKLFTGPYLAEVYLAQGRLTQARAALDWVTGGLGAPADGPCYFYMVTEAKLSRLLGDPEAGLRAALRGGERFAAHGGENPALIPWRSEAALCLGELGRADEGRELAEAELALARKWGAPRAVSRALRVLGTLAAGQAGLPMLREAVDILVGTKADLDRAESLVGYGTRLNHLRRTADAKRFLREGLELAEACGADGLVSAGRRELTSAGARPRRLAMSGVRSLTPSERRIVELAAQGHTNRVIAQQLFITVKTVEIHLTAAYKKLRVQGRDELAAVLDESS